MALNPQLNRDKVTISDLDNSYLRVNEYARKMGLDNSNLSKKIKKGIVEAIVIRGVPFIHVDTPLPNRNRFNQ